jgi:hypothetical protein
MDEEAISSHDQLHDNKGGVAEYKPDARGHRGVALEQHHSHFIIVRLSAEAASEKDNRVLALRNSLEEAFCRRNNAIAKVNVVLGGHNSTLHAIMLAVEARQQVVLVRGSGGVADVISMILEAGKVEASLLARYIPDMPSDVKAILAETCRAGKENNLFSIFDIKDDDFRDIDGMLYEAIMLAQNYLSPLRKIERAIRWNQVLLLKFLLENHRDELCYSSHPDFGLMYGLLDYALQKAILRPARDIERHLEEQRLRASIVHLILNVATQVSSVALSFQKPSYRIS